MSLKAWLDKGALRAHKPSKKEIAGLLALADRDLADARVAGLSTEGRFQFAYNAALAMASAALHASACAALSETLRTQTRLMRAKRKACPRASDPALL